TKTEANNGSWEDDTRTRCRIMWKKPAEWAAEIYDFTVARLPLSLTITDEVTAATESTFISGFLRTKGEKNWSFEWYYMELNGSLFSCYKEKLEESSVPLTGSDKKAMEIAVEPEEKYHHWLKAICSVVKFSAVHILYKRMFLLQEVSSLEITGVRVAVRAGDTVGEIVEHIFNCYKQALDAPPMRSYDPSKYQLKITGSRDYLVDWNRISEIHNISTDPDADFFETEPDSSLHITTLSDDLEHSSLEKSMT
ncbi:hypothetical protein PybrP1_011619, partial [[Pythium] brassicae (nom. inval.)]